LHREKREGGFRASLWPLDLIRHISIFLPLILFCYFFRDSTNAEIYIRTSIHSYEYTHTHHIFMINSERLSRLDLEIYEIGHQERLAVDGNVASH
jgi:hypothetical protein